MFVMFTESDFIKAAAELDNLSLDGFEFFTESDSDSVNCKIYRKYDQESGLYSYKVLGSISDCPPEICYQVYMDLEYRKTWDAYVKELYEFEMNGTKGIYWNVNYPWPMANRDYSYVREGKKITHNDIQTWVVIANSCQLDIPEVSGVIRVLDFNQSLVARSDGKKGTEAYMFYFDNPRGMIPAFVINWAAKTGVPSFLTSMRKACLQYKKYLESKK